MLTLGIDTSGKTASCALCDGENVIASYMLSSGNTHSQKMLPMIKQIITDSGKNVSDIKLIATCSGPGSYTGLRIGIATAKAIAYSNNCECCSVSTLEAYAYSVLGFEGIICAVMFARKELMYTAFFRASKDGKIERLSEDMIISTQEVVDKINSYDDAIYIVGDIADTIKESYTGEKALILPKYHTSLAVSTCLASLNLEHTDSFNLQPDYLQPTLAEKQQQSK